MFLTLFVSNLISQKVIVKGNIINNKGDNIEFVTVQLLFNSICQQATISDSLGNYYIETTKRGECELETNILGYAHVKKKLNIEKDTTINIILDIDPYVLKELTILGKDDLIEAQSDKFLINIGGKIETKGKETTDILKLLPTIYISDGTLNIFGKSSAILLINDRNIRLEGQTLLNYLNSLPPDIIKSVEIISTPPAQYDAEGNVGIINIITTKNIHPGWNEYFKLGFIKNSYSSGLFSAYARYSGQKLFFEGNLTNSNFAYLNQNSYYCSFPNVITSTFNPKKWNSIGSDVRGSLGYNFNKNYNIIFDFKIPIYNKEIVSDIQNETTFINSATNKADSTIFSKGVARKKLYTYDSEVFFKHIFSNKGSYFTASAAYLNNQTKNSRVFNSITQVENIALNDEDFATEGNQKYAILTSKLDLNFFIQKFTINTGFKTSFIKNSSYNIFIINGSNDSSQLNKYQYSENVQSIYFSAEKSIYNWSFKAGVRSEFTGTKGISLTINEEYKNEYIDFFPSLNISKKINDNSNISLSYATRIERAPYQYLDPFKWYISKYDYALGNPFLNPSYTKNIEVTYFTNVFSTKLYYTLQKDIIGRYVELDSFNFLSQVQKTDNFFNVNSYGINIYSFLKRDKWLETVLQGNFAYYKYFSNKKEFSNISGLNGTFTLMNTFFLNDKIQIVCNIEESIPGLYNYRIKDNFFKFDIGLNFIHSKKGFEVRLLISDLFKTANPEYYYISGGIKQVYNNYNDTQMLKLISTWRLGNWYNRRSSISSPSNSDEKERLLN